MPDSADTLLAFVESAYGEGRILALYAPSLAGDEHFSAWFSELERASVSPAMARKLIELYLRTDVGPILGAIRAPTLVVHRRDDTHIPIAKGRELAAQIPGAQLVELEGRDNLVVAGDGRAVLDEFGRFLLGKRRPVEADRVLATVLFVDIVGSTERAAAMGDRKWMSVLTLYHRRALAEIEAHGGHLVRSLGDGTLATFDCPARAIGAARAIRAAAAALGLRVRAGLHTGEIELTGDDVGGIGVHLAARVLDAAAPDQILTSQTVKDLVFGSGLRFTARGGHELRGIPGTWQLYAVADAIVATVA